MHLNLTIPPNTIERNPMTEWHTYLHQHVVMLVIYFSGSTLFVVTMSRSERICRKQLLSYKLATRVNKVFVSAPRVTPMGWTIVGVKSTFQL
jgi:hypothetical protein